MSQLQALHGNEAKSWFYHIPTRQLDTKRLHAYAWLVTLKQIVMHLLRWNGALALFVYVSVLQ